MQPLMALIVAILTVALVALPFEVSYRRRVKRWQKQKGGGPFMVTRDV